MKKLIIICGSPASGKSSYARKLAAAGNSMLLDIDTCTEPIIQVALSETNRDANDRDSNYFKQTYRTTIYETLFAIAKENIANIDVIIVGPFSNEIKDPKWREKLIERFRTDIEIHYIHCDPHIRKDRMLTRANLRDQSKLVDWDKYLKYYGEEKPPSFEHIFVNNS